MNRLRTLYQDLLLWLFLHGIIRRITSPIVLAAQRQTGLGLIHNRFFSDSAKAACPIGMLTTAARGMKVRKLEVFHSSARAEQVLKRPWAYLLGFTTGFDWKPVNCTPTMQKWFLPASVKKDQEADFHRGMKDGQKARRELM